MTLRLVSSSGRPARGSWRRRPADRSALRAIDCRPDLYERLRESWPQSGGSRRGRVAALTAAALLAIAISIAVALRFYPGPLPGIR